MARKPLAAAHHVPSRASLPSRRRERLPYRDWAPHHGISSKGKHIYDFETGFPLAVFCHRFPYRTMVPNYHDYLEIGYVSEGSGLLLISDKEYVLGPDDVMIVGSDEVHTVQADERKPLSIVSVFFLPSVIVPPAADDASFDLTRPFFADSRHVLKAGEYDHAGVFRTLLRMHRLAMDRPQYHRLLLRHMLFDLLLRILRAYDQQGLLEEKAADNTPDRRSRIHRLNRVFALVESRFGEHIPLAEVANLCGMSPNYFCRFFKSVTGTSFVEYVNRFRMNRAKLLMLGGDLTTTQVAYQVGFSNLGYFYRAFRKYADLTPREFMRKYRS